MKNKEDQKGVAYVDITEEPGTMGPAPVNANESAIRYNDDKLQWSLVDFESLEGMVRVLEFGAQKYTADNWKKGLKVSEIMESLLRHAFALMRGEECDPESGLPHIGHIQCNAMFAAYMLKHKPEFNDVIAATQQNQRP